MELTSSGDTGFYRQVVPTGLYKMNYSFKQKLGAVVYDLPRFLWSIRPSSDHSWVYIRNRDERLSSVNGLRSAVGVKCEWQWTSDLHIAKVFPSLGRALMRRALRDWPIMFRSAPLQQDENPEVSFIIGHRGLERLPHLLLTLKSIAAQRDAAFECIVVEQSARPEIEEHLPAWVRYVHTPLPHADMPYCRAWAFNTGARRARGEILVVHDNDMLVPHEYAAEIVKRRGEGYEVMNLKRFIFFLDETHSSLALKENGLPLEEAPESVMQNALGGSVAVTRNAYLLIGGFDESFVGWGGEDNEFWERAQTRRVWPYGYLPMAHLWHRIQTGKYDEGRLTARLLKARSAVPASERIAELKARDFGNPEARDQKSEIRSQARRSERSGQKAEADL